MDGLSAPDPVESRTEASKCAPKYPLCQAYDYGYYWASHWLAYSHQLRIGPKLWWLDVENGASWTTPTMNAAVIRGAADALHSQGVVVGVYSGPGHTATALCKSGGYNFAGGHLKMVQYGYTGSFPGAYPTVSPYDYDYVCS